MSFSLKAYRTYTSLIKYLVFQGVPVSVRCLSSVLWRSSRVRLCSVALSISESLRESVTFFHKRLKTESHIFYKHSSKKKKTKKNTEWIPSKLTVILINYISWIISIISYMSYKDTYCVADVNVQDAAVSASF